MNNLITHAVVLAVSSAKLCDSYFCKFLIARRRRRGFASAGLFMLDLENVVSSTPDQPPGTLFHPIFITSLTLVLSENDSRMYFLIALIADYCWRSWTCHIAAPYKFYVD